MFKFVSSGFSTVIYQFEWKDSVCKYNSCKSCNYISFLAVDKYSDNLNRTWYINYELWLKFKNKLENLNQS